MARLVFALCLLFGHKCKFAVSHTTHYCPELEGVNGEFPYNITASGHEVEPGVTAACGPKFPFGTRVYLEGVGWRTCWDQGGAIIGYDTDILIGLEECEWVPYEWQGETLLWCANWRTGEREAVWMSP